MYIITGATGNTGGRIAETLLSNGKKVRVIGRNIEKLRDFAAKGAEIAVGNINESSFLANSFEGATAVYAMIPPNMTAENFRKYQNEISDALLNAIVNSGVKYVVMLSSIGAHLTQGSGVVQGLYDFEQKLNSLDNINCVYLRAGYFMENLNTSIGMIKNMGIYGTPLKPDAIIPNVATQDIADKAADFLLNLNFKGKEIHYVLGPRDITPTEQAKIIGNAMGQPGLPYVQFPYEEAEKGNGRNGISRKMS